MPVQGEKARVWVGKNNPQTQVLAKKAADLIKGKVVMSVEGEGDQIVLYMHDGSRLAINSQGGFHETN